MLLKQSLLPSVITSLVALVTFGMNPVTAQNISAGTASKKSVNQLIELARSNSPDLREAIRSSFDPKQLAAGTAWLGHGHDFFFATEAAATPELFIDGRRGPDMHPAGASLWYAAARIEGLGKPHSFSYQVAGAKVGGSFDVPAFGPESYRQPVAPAGMLSERIVHTSKIYDGMRSEEHTSELQSHA